jgi:predicted O-methyltransferase YrrM
MALTSGHRVRELLSRAFGEDVASRDKAFIRAGMSRVELVRLHELARSPGIQSVLEVGMANGTSSVVFCDALADEGGHLTSIDPYQSVTPPQGYGSAGIHRVHELGFGSMHRLLDEPDYLALPRLVEEGTVFDMIFIDGYHSFDYTMVDLFFSDLLLRPGGILAFHDSTSEAVCRAIRFLERHKPYERLSPPVSVYRSELPHRILARLRVYLSGPTVTQEARSRRDDWMMLSAYRKLESRQAPEFHCKPL